MKTWLFLNLLALVVTFVVVYFLWQWTYRAFDPPLEQIKEAIDKPWRPFARLALSSIVAVLMLSTQVYVAARVRRA